MPRLVLPPPRFTHQEWATANRRKNDAAEREREWAERVEAESERLRDEAKEVMQKAKADVKRKFEQRVLDLQRWKEELIEREKRLGQEIEDLETYKRRMETALKNYTAIMKTTLQCLSMREQRLSIDLVHDDVQRELLKELDVIKGVEAVLTKTIEETEEQLRLDKKALYHVHNDLRDKDETIRIDSHAGILDDFREEVALTDDPSVLNEGRTSMKEWESFTRTNILNADGAHNGSRQLRVMIDGILQQTCRDLQVQCQKVNCAFEHRIKETKQAKDRLEDQIFEVNKRIREMECNLEKLDKAIMEKERTLALAQTQLKQRRTRPNVEQSRDEVEARLLVEVREMEIMIMKLQNQVRESKSSLRNLLRNLVSIQDDYNIKANSLDVDDVMCMSIRQSLVIAPY